jgi:dTDP-4-amino-4,6-dideoxygalactose transaminase
LALSACGIGLGDEVITVPNTYAATVFAISYVGATPVFVDVEQDTFNMDVTKIEARITPRTKAILPVHLYGLPVDMNPLMEIAHDHHLWVIEDVSHAHGALYKERRVGSLGHMGCFSFYPRKVLGGYGDGGAVTLNDDQLYSRFKSLCSMEQNTNYTHGVVGFQQRLDDIQAVILSIKLRHLEQWIEVRRRWAMLYTELLSDLPVITPKEGKNVRHVYYQYTIRTPRRDELLRFLAERGIGSQVMYPLEVPYQPAYYHLGYKKGDFPVADAHVKEILCLPMFPELMEDEVCEVAGAIRDFFA